MTPLLRPVWCRAGPDSFSSTVTRVPGAARVIAYAVDSPTIPPPTTSTSQSYATIGTTSHPDSALHH